MLMANRHMVELYEIAMMNDDGNCLHVCFRKKSLKVKFFAVLLRRNMALKAVAATLVMQK